LETERNKAAEGVKEKMEGAIGIRNKLRSKLVGNGRVLKLRIERGRCSVARGGGHDYNSGGNCQKKCA